MTANEWSAKTRPGTLRSQTPAFDRSLIARYGMDYFKPLHHKLGVVTLLMACLLTAAWVRSRGTVDFVLVISGDRRMECLVSMANHVAWIGIRDVPLDGKVRYGQWGSARLASLLPTPNVDRSDRQLLESFYDVNAARWIIPYWLIVIPLTLLSAYLVLIRRR